MSTKFTGEAGRKSAPAVSVIIPAYNTAAYLRETLESVFAQTIQDFEVIVVNDGSPDTAQLENVLLGYQGRIQYSKQSNRGVSAARNAGIRSAQGEFLAFLDGDDIWLPSFLAEQLQFFAKNPSFDMACADCVYFGNSDLAGKTWQILDYIENPATFQRVLPTHGGAFASFALLRRATVLKVGFFDEELRLLEDYEYWLRLLYRGGRLGYLRKVLGKRRIHSESLTYNPDVVVPHAIIALRKLEKILDPASEEASLVKKEIAFATAQLSLAEGRRRLRLEDYAGCKDCFEKAQAGLRSRKTALALFGLRLAPRLTRRAILHWDSGFTAHPVDDKRK